MEAFALGGGRLTAVEGDELERAGLVLCGDEGGADVERVSGAKRMRDHDALGVTPHDVGGGDLRPALPRVEEVPPHEG